MSGERLSSILEIVSFALVTTDLYGKERLQKFRGKFKSFTKEAFDDLMSKFSPLVLSLFSIFLVLLTIYICWISPIIELGAYKHYDLFDWLIIVVITGGFCYVAFKYGYVVSFYLIAFFYFAMGEFTFLLLKYLLKLFPVEGILLFLGTICFLISKLIVFPK